MSKCLEAQYEALKKRFMKTYGEEHLCGNCTHTFDCIRMKIQGIRDLDKKRALMRELKFVKKFKIEPLDRNVDNINRIYFISVFDCGRFEFDKGEHK